MPHAWSLLGIEINIHNMTVLLSPSNQWSGWPSYSNLGIYLLDAFGVVMLMVLDLSRIFSGGATHLLKRYLRQNIIARNYLMKQLVKNLLMDALELAKPYSSPNAFYVDSSAH